MTRIYPEHQINDNFEVDHLARSFCVRNIFPTRNQKVITRTMDH